MFTPDWLSIVLLAGALVLLGPPLGAYMARVFEGRPLPGLDRVVGPLERGLYRIAGVERAREMTWQRYAVALLLFNGAGLVVVYLLQSLQGVLPLNPDGLGPVPPAVAFNTAVSFATNTNWQSYGGETTMSYLTQTLGLTVQNFLSAATGIAVAVALVRGLARREAQHVGNFWVDVVRATLYVLLPLSLVYALVLASQGVVQTFAGHATALLLDPRAGADGGPIVEQALALGPAASQVAIKQLGTNGGGFFNVNAAHPFENPTAVTNFLELLAILLIGAALPFTFGRMVGDRRQGRAIFLAMLLLFLPFVGAAPAAEVSGNPAIAALGVDATPGGTVEGGEQPGGNMEGKEVRFGPVASGVWAAATTAASNGSVNAMHDSFTPLGGLTPLFLMQLGEVVFGGVGSGLYGMLAFALIAVFVAGLMVGRTPEYLGKKIEAFEMKMAALIVLLPTAVILIGTALGVATGAGRAGIQDPGAHGFSEVLYAFTSAGANNGSAFAGLTASSPFYAITQGLAMLLGRFGVAVPALAIAGSLARKKAAPASAGTLATHGTLFVALLIGTVLLVGALSFVPALALGPVVEHVSLMAGR